MHYNISIDHFRWFFQWFASIFQIDFWTICHWPFNCDQYVCIRVYIDWICFYGLVNSFFDISMGASYCNRWYIVVKLFTTFSTNLYLLSCSKLQAKYVFSYIHHKICPFRNIRVSFILINHNFKMWCFPFVYRRCSLWNV